MPRGIAGGVPRHQGKSRGESGQHGDHQRDDEDHPDDGDDGSERDGGLAAALTADHREGDADREQHETQDRRAGRRRRIAATAGEDRDDILLATPTTAGTTAARNALSNPKAATISDHDPVDVDRSEPGGAEPLHDRDQRPPEHHAEHATERGGHRTEHDARGQHDPTGLAGRAAAGGHQGQGAGLAACPTAKAGPARSTTSSRAMAMISATTATYVAESIPAEQLGHLRRQRRRVLDDGRGSGPGTDRVELARPPSRSRRRRRPAIRCRHRPRLSAAAELRAEAARAAPRWWACPARSRPGRCRRS